MIHVEFEADKRIYRCCCIEYEATEDCFENEWGGVDTECETYGETDESDNTCRYASIEFGPTLVIGDFKRVVFEDDCLTVDRKHYRFKDYRVRRLSINGKTYIPKAEENT